MWERELLAIGVGALVLANGGIVWTIYRMVCYPHPTWKSAQEIHRLTATVSRLKAEMRELERQRDDLRTTVYTLSRQAQQLRQSLSSEPSQ